MSLEVGSRLGHYDVTALIGEGGMGQVYQATDTKLNRQVALKILPEAFASDPDRLARFQREAQVLASLNHPGIAAIYGIEESDDTRALVLELVEGPTLADRIAKGSIPVDEALPIAKQIAEALEAAHEKFVIHRDLKPANIKITPEGRVKVLDFGLAKTFIGDQANGSHSTTLSIQATQQGVIMGTAAYMSPEQAQGEEVDKRSDIWSFGCVLFEMLTGQKVFVADNVSHTLARILERDPDFSLLAPNLSPKLQELLERCLEKDPAIRWHDIADVRVDIQKVLANPTGGATPASVATGESQTSSKLPWVAAIVLSSVLTGLGFWLLTSEPVRIVTRFDDVLPNGRNFRNTGHNVVAISPDGTRFVYNGVGGLYLRALGEREARLIVGTEPDLTNPVFSPDGESLAYFSPGDTQLKKIAVVGGVGVSLTSLRANPIGLSWDTDDVIVFAAGNGSGILSVASAGGEPEELFAPSNMLVGQPQLLPGGALLFNDTQNNVYVLAAGAEEPTRLFSGTRPRFVLTGHIVYALNDVLYAVPFDIDTLGVTGGQVPLVEGVQVRPPQYAVSDTGTLVYVRGTGAGGANANVLMALVDETGRSDIIDDRPAQYRVPRVSPDGGRIAVEIIGDDGQSSIWIYDLSDAGTAPSRLTLPTEGNNTDPAWNRDGQTVAYWSDRHGASGIYRQVADGAGSAERLTMPEGNDIHRPEAWSPDGLLSFARILGGATGATSFELWTVRPGEEAELYYDLDFSNQFGSTFSPDGEWIAYSSGEVQGGGPSEFGIYVERFPDRTDRREVSRDGASWPVWTGEGEITFRLTLTQRATLMQVDILETEPTFRVTQPRELPISTMLFFEGRDFDVAPDGRLLVLVPSDTQAAEAVQPQINVVLNWSQELLERVPVN